MTKLTWLMVLGCLVAAPAGAVEEGDEPRLPDLVLTPRNFAALDPDVQVNYIKFYLNFMAHAEDLQMTGLESSKEDKSALFRTLFPLAVADGSSSLEGTPCLNAMNRSTWAVNSRTGNVYCRPVPSPDCGSGMRGCGQTITRFAGPICAPVEGEGTLTGRCVEKITAMGNAKVETQFRRAIREGAYERSSEGIKGGLGQTHARIYGNMSIRDYCAGEGARLQRRECTQMARLVDGFDANVVGGKNPYDAHGRYRETPEIRRRIDSIQTVRQNRRHNPCETRTYARSANEPGTLVSPSNCNVRRPQKLRYRSDRIPHTDTYPPKPLPPPDEPPGTRHHPHHPHHPVPPNPPNPPNPPDNPWDPIGDLTEWMNTRTAPWYGPSPDPEEVQFARAMGNGNGRGGGGTGNNGSGGNGPGSSGGGPGGGSAGPGGGGGGSPGGPGGGGGGGSSGGGGEHSSSR